MPHESPCAWRRGFHPRPVAAIGRRREPRSPARSTRTDVARTPAWRSRAFRSWACSRRLVTTPRWCCDRVRSRWPGSFATTPMPIRRWSSIRTSPSSRCASMKKNRKSGSWRGDAWSPTPYRCAGALVRHFPSRAASFASTRPARACTSRSSVNSTCRRCCVPASARVPTWAMTSHPPGKRQHALPSESIGSTSSTGPSTSPTRAWSCRFPTASSDSTARWWASRASRAPKPSSRPKAGSNPSAMRVPPVGCCHRHPRGSPTSASNSTTCRCRCSRPIPPRSPAGRSRPAGSGWTCATASSMATWLATTASGSQT